MTVCSLISKPNSVLGQAVCSRKEKKRAAQDHVVCTVCMYAKPVLVSSICWVCIGCVCMGTRAETSKYSQLELALSKYSRVFLSNSRESTVLLLCFFLLFWHILAAAAVCYSFLQRKLSLSGLHAALYPLDKTRQKREEIPACPVKGNLLPSQGPLM